MKHSSKEFHLVPSDPEGGFNEASGRIMNSDWPIINDY